MFDPNAIEMVKLVAEGAGCSFRLSCTIPSPLENTRVHWQALRYSPRLLLASDQTSDS